MTLPIQTTIIKNVQVIQLSALEVMSPRNAVLAPIVIAQGNKSRHERMAGLKITDSHCNIENWLGGNARNSSAADVLNV